MKRKNNTMPKIAGPDEHLEALGPLLAQLKTHLSESAGKKGTYGDYLRLLEYFRGAHGRQAREILVGWVDENTEPLPREAQ
jgi:hypothetical protein